MIFYKPIRNNKRGKSEEALVQARLSTENGIVSGKL